MESQHFILGAEVSSFEEEIKAYVPCRYAIGCASGSDALLLALLALGVGPRDEVIVPPFTFVATAGAVARVGACPVFSDIDPQTLNLDPQQLQNAITDRTRAIMPVHLFGLSADMDPILEIARAANVAVIEDAAQAIGAQYRDKAVGTMGACGCFSFFPSKNLGGAGDGGMVTTNRPELAERIRLLRTHGSRRKYEYEILGMNSRLDALQAAILRVKLPYLEEWNAARRGNAERYQRWLAEAGLEDGVTLPIEPAGSRHVYNQFTIRVRERDAFREHLHKMGVPTEIYYQRPLHLQSAFNNLGYRKGDLSIAEQASEEVVSLPVYPELTEQQQRRIVDAIAAFFSGK
jgi:dTDP-4-amino-4,6-dideoxygalactose transaminase